MRVACYTLLTHTHIHSSRVKKNPKPVEDEDDYGVGLDVLAPSCRAASSLRVKSR